MSAIETLVRFTGSRPTATLSVAGATCERIPLATARARLGDPQLSGGGFRLVCYSAESASSVAGLLQELQKRGGLTVLPRKLTL